MNPMNDPYNVPLSALLREVNRRNGWDDIDLRSVPLRHLTRALNKRLAELRSIVGDDSNHDFGAADVPDDREWIRKHLGLPELSDQNVMKYKAKLLASQRCVAMVFWMAEDPPEEDGEFLIPTRPPVLVRNAFEPDYFTEQWSIPGAFSGFLASPTRFVTARHAIDESVDVSKLCILFDYTAKKAITSPVRVPRGSFHRPVRELYRGIGKDDDFVILEMSPVSDRAAPIRREGKIGDTDRIHMIGHPYGFPVKVAGRAQVLENSHEKLFEHYLDALGGHSGAPVFNADTHVIEGILRSAAADIVEGDDPGDVDDVFRICIEGQCPRGTCVRTTAFAQYL